MNTIDFIALMNEVEDEMITESDAQIIQKKPIVERWGAAAAFLAAMLAGALLLRGNLNGSVLDQTHTLHETYAAQRPISAYIQEDVQEAVLTVLENGKVRSASIRGTELDALREWTKALRYTPTSFSPGQTPADWPGTKAYTIALSQGDYPGYSYYVTESSGNYLWIEGYWYQVTSASPIPVPKGS